MAAVYSFRYRPDHRILGIEVFLVPTTEVLLDSRDRTTTRAYTDLVRDEDFLGSHILRVSPGTSFGGKDVNNVRERRGKAKSYTTVNGRTVIIKENMVYSNKGFKDLTQAQLLSDAIYFSTRDEQNWLIYYISKPLVGTVDAMPVVPALIPGRGSEESLLATSDGGGLDGDKRVIQSFSNLLELYPLVDMQMRPGLASLFDECDKVLGKPLPSPPSRASSMSHHSEDSPSKGQSNGSIHSGEVNGRASVPFHSTNFLEDEEDQLRGALETAVTGAIDLFQSLSQKLLSWLGATTNLTGPAAERLIEQYVAEQVHGDSLFPRVCSIHRAEDQELDRRIQQMENVDVSQVGIVIDGGRAGKNDLLRRLSNGVEAFRKMSSACSPLETLEVLLATERAITGDVVGQGTLSESPSEKLGSVVTVNADVLVASLLIVVIRSHTRHLLARLSYMQRFIYIEDVESGEVGYALSTFEAVLSYLMQDSGGLRKASMRNRRLWNATKAGNLSEMKSIFEPNEGDEEERLFEEPQELLYDTRLGTLEAETTDSTQPGSPFACNQTATGASGRLSASFEPSLSHVFPFQTSSTAVAISSPPKKGKKVSMDIRSLSGSSAVSFHSRTTTIGSTISGLEGDTSIENLASTQDSTGKSIPMMAVEGGQVASLRYLLSLEDYYPSEVIFDDTTVEGTTLLSAAIQLAHTELTDIILNYLFQKRDGPAVVDYLGKADCRGRTAAHYLFNAPQYLSRLNNKLPWRRKDRIGQTPLFALCRSYDHPDYRSMVSEALTLAMEAQGDSMPLRLGDHVDSKGNTLLHVVNDPSIILRILRCCDTDPNAANDKQFTPVMLASKYGRIDMVRAFIADPRVDMTLKERRGLTAVELAKDDEVRNRIDDLTLFSGLSQSSDSQTRRHATAIVRSYFVEDGTTRFVLKSGAPSNNFDPTDTAITIVTSRRTLEDFQNLARWLALEHPASYLPDISSTRNPFQIVSKPSRAVLHDLQSHLDRFLKSLLGHPTFGTHESLWEFLLVPDMQPGQMAERARLKAKLLKETIQEEYDPVSDIVDVEQNSAHGQQVIQTVASRTRPLLCRGHSLQRAQSDLGDALNISATALSSLGPPANVLPASHTAALKMHASLMTTPTDSSPMKAFIENVTGVSSTTSALRESFTRPTSLVSELISTTQSVARHRTKLANQSLPRKFNFPGTEDSRHRAMMETENLIDHGEQEVARLSRELRWTSEVVVGELAGWTAWREKVGRAAVKRLARDTVIKEKERGKGLERCLRDLREAQ